MGERWEIHDDFVARFHVGNRKGPFTDPRLDKVEPELNTIFPTANQMFVRRHGTVCTPAILETIVNKVLRHTDIQEFPEPNAVTDNPQLYRPVECLPRSLE